MGLLRVERVEVDNAGAIVLFPNPHHNMLVVAGHEDRRDVRRERASDVPASWNAAARTEMLQGLFESFRQVWMAIAILLHCRQRLRVPRQSKGHARTVALCYYVTFVFRHIVTYVRVRRAQQAPEKVGWRMARTTRTSFATLDSRDRLNLAGRATSKVYIIREEPNGRIILEPASVVSNLEQRVLANPRIVDALKRNQHGTAHVIEE